MKYAVFLFACKSNTIYYNSVPMFAKTILNFANLLFFYVLEIQKQ